MGSSFVEKYFSCSKVYSVVKFTIVYYSKLLYTIVFFFIRDSNMT